MVFLLWLLKNIKNISTLLNVKTLFFFARRKQYFQYTRNSHGNFALHYQLITVYGAFVT